MTKAEIQRHSGWAENPTREDRWGRYRPYWRYNRDRDPGDEDEDGRCLSPREQAERAEAIEVAMTAVGA